VRNLGAEERDNMPMFAGNEDTDQRGNRLLTLWKGRFGPIIRAILSISLIAILVYHIGSGEIIESLKAVSWQTLAGATLVLGASVLLVTPRWAAILSVLGCQASWNALIGSVFLGSLFNQLLPTVIGGDVLRALRAKQLGAPWKIAIYSVLLDRVSGVLIALFGAGVLLPFAATFEGQARLEWIIAAVIASMGFALLTIRIFGRFLRTPIPLFARIQRGLVRLHGSIRTFTRKPGATTIIFVLAACNQMLSVAAIMIFARATGVSLPVTDLVLITFVTTLAATIPLSIAGWGIREGTLVYLFGIHGIRPDLAFTVSILYGFALLLSTIPGALFILRTRSAFGG
jgi:uncharacterized protein (TIRG00374 family)